MRLFHLRQPAVLCSIGEIDRKPDHQPHRKTEPGVERQAEHQKDRGDSAQGRDHPYCRRPERALQAGLAMRNASVPIETTANANSVPMLTSSPTSPIGRIPASTATTAPEPMVETCGVWKRG